MLQWDISVRPGAPQQVEVRQKDTNWMVEWVKPSTPSKVRLCYQVCYYSTQEQVSFHVERLTFPAWQRRTPR